jgi:hypothetical protein
MYNQEGDYMSKGTLKQSFLNGAHAALNVGGNALAWTPVGAIALATAFGNAWGNHDSILDTVMKLDAPSAIMFTGMLAGGLVAAAAGYSRYFGGDAAPRKGRISHAFNFAASSAGAAALAVGAFALLSMRLESSSLQSMAVPAAIALAGAASFAVGHKRLLGPTLPVTPKP